VAPQRCARQTNRLIEKGFEKQTRSELGFLGASNATAIYENKITRSKNRGGQTAAKHTGYTKNFVKLNIFSQ
jgi:hypothetical protein